MGTFISRASLLDLPIVLRTHIQFLFSESALLDWWLSDIPSARSGVAGRYTGQAAGPSLCQVPYGRHFGHHIVPRSQESGAPEQLVKT